MKQLHENHTISYKIIQNYNNYTSTWYNFTMKHIIKVIHGEIYSPDFAKLDQLINNWSSAHRYAFNRFQKDSLSFNDVIKATKRVYYPFLQNHSLER